MWSVTSQNSTACCWASTDGARRWGGAVAGPQGPLWRRPWGHGSSRGEGRPARGLPAKAVRCAISHGKGRQMRWFQAVHRRRGLGARQNRGERLRVSDPAAKRRRCATQVQSRATDERFPALFAHREGFDEHFPRIRTPSPGRRASRAARRDSAAARRNPPPVGGCPPRRRPARRGLLLGDGRPAPPRAPRPPERVLCSRRAGGGAFCGARAGAAAKPAPAPPSVRRPAPPGPPPRASARCGR